MRARRGLLLGVLTLTVALAVAPPLAASPLRTFADPLSLTAIDRLASWLSRLAGWLDRDGPEPRPAVARSCADAQDGSDPCPPSVPTGDSAVCIDPNGNRVPCAP